ncbi:hypothetical protein ABZ678_01435 [Streptomyces hirsutus]|uniref:hypothetical protein n=1 Tax=Streptomyces hirsutus TaxID=35620 RepID=UPI0033ED050E
MGNLLKTRATAYAALLLAAATALTGCDDGTGADSSKPATGKPAATAEQELTQEQKDENSKAAGLPLKPTGQEREQLLDTLAEAAPDVVRHEDKAIDAARNQCSSINNGSPRLDWMAGRRFTYKDVTTSEVQGKAINDALKASGFCKV